MKRLFAIALFAMLSGCAQFGLITNEVADRGAAVADAARDTAEFTLCRGISVGAWVRRYGDSADLANAWRTLCSTSIKQVPK